MKMTISVGRCLKRKIYVSVSKGVHQQKLCNLRKFSQIARIVLCFQRKAPKCKYWVIKVLSLETQMVCSGWLENDSLILLLERWSKCWVASPCSWLGFDIETLKLTLSCLKYFHKNLFAITFISPSFTRVFFLTGPSLVHFVWKCSW